MTEFNPRNDKVSMSAERRDLAKAITAATAEVSDAQVDVKAVRDILTDQRTKAEANIATITKNENAIDDEYAAFKARCKASRDEQQAVIAMMDAAIAAGPKPPEAKVVEHAKKGKPDDETK